jgi:hypothetical protein
VVASSCSSVGVVLGIGGIQFSSEVVNIFGVSQFLVRSSSTGAGIMRCRGSQFGGE